MSYKLCLSLVFCGFCWALNAQQYAIEEMPDVNGSYLDFKAVHADDGVYFTSSRPSGRLIFRKDKRIKQPFMDLYFAKANKEGYDKPTRVFGAVNRKYHDGAITFTPDGNTMILSRNNMKGKNSNDEVAINLYAAQRAGNQWTDITELPFNDAEYSTCHPAFTPDGKWMVFASNRSGSAGKMDLFKVPFANGNWGAPQALGINSQGNDIFPEVGADGTLYFASDRSGGLGGLDLYQATMNADGTWNTPMLMAAPLNTAADDFGLTMNADNRSGSFTSNRNGGSGADDLYNWSVANLAPAASGPVAQTVALDAPLMTQTFYVYDEKTEDRIAAAPAVLLELAGSQEWVVDETEYTTDRVGEFTRRVLPSRKYAVVVEAPGYAPKRLMLTGKEALSSTPIGIPLAKSIAGTFVLKGSLRELTSNRPGVGKRLTLVNRCDNSSRTLVPDANGNFNADLNCDCDYDLREEDNFVLVRTQRISGNCATKSPVEVALQYRESTTPGMTTVSGPAAGNIIALKDVYYDYDKFNIRGDASVDLDKAVALMNEYPSMSIEMRSHTDARGSDAYNLTLSQNRAQAAKEYLVKRGISASRIQARGYGETELINRCANGVQCSKAEHQENRRTEIKVLGM